MIKVISGSLTTLFTLKVFDVLTFSWGETFIYAFVYILLVGALEAIRNMDNRRI